MAARQWTEEQRKQQSFKIRQWQPWQGSTGARTVEGKKKVSRNAFKGGIAKKIQTLAKLLREQKMIIEAL